MLISYITSSRNQSNGEKAEEDIVMISHHVIRTMLSCRISTRCMIKVIIMGDFNGNVTSNKHYGRLDTRSKDLCSFMNFNNYIATKTVDICMGATPTFVSCERQSESVIDHFIIPVEKQDTVKDCVLLDDDELNVSRHRPIYYSLSCP